MISCPSCGTENPEGQKFCGECATPLAAAPTRSVAEERKVVTALFCDLIGFTATSESADPEDVDGMLAGYFAMARTAIEAFGGVVEKFIGDAVVGVFGVPASHEDDPERAIRAGLRIAERAEDLEAVGGAPLRLRVGINTGEALVRLGISPGSGEGFLAGDAINTASRIQSVAPEMGVAVGLGTYEATAQVFDYEELEPATLKGKSEPVRVFHARSPLARLGTDLTRTHDSPYVGRTADLSMLKGMFDKSVEADSVQMVTVVGEPGIGKSRIVAELLAHAQTREPRLTWRQGRCLPYGDGVTFWALGEIIKAHTGILETDDPEQAGQKLGNAVPEGPDREWLRRRLLPLVGIDASSSAEREELFTAWRTFLETVAEQTPTVLVFEDIHWADDAMLAFLEHLADRAAGVSLLLVATARPELFERHATFAQGLHNANRINLAPLSDAETAELVSGLLDASEIPEEIRVPILERAEGNPLYVEEFLRLLRDQDLLHQEGDTWVLREGAELPLPGSIQSLIAARLDTLAPERKAMLSDAAVVGKVFWAGAVARMGDRKLEEVTEAMRELTRKELVRSTRRSSMEGEVEYSFWHVLARDVAYSQLPRPARAARHVAAASWLEDKAGDRVEDIAEVLAHHYATALELSKAAGKTEDAEALEGLALSFLTLAGERGLNLDIAAALADFERALALTPPGHPARPGLLVQMAKAVGSQGRAAEAVALLEEAIAAFEAMGDEFDSIDAEINLAKAVSRAGDARRAAQLADALVARLEPSGPSERLAEMLGFAARYGGVGDRYENPPLDDPFRLAQEERAILMAEDLGLAGMRNELIADRALRRHNMGDPRGMDELRESLSFARETGDNVHVARMYYWLSSCMGGLGNPNSALAFAEEGLAFTRARGMGNFDFFIRQDRAVALFRLGRWGDLLEGADAQLEEASVLGLGISRTINWKIHVLSRMGFVEEAAGLALENIEDDRGYEFCEERIRDLRARGEDDAAIALLEDAIRDLREDHASILTVGVVEISRDALALGRIDLAKDVATLERHSFGVNDPAAQRSYDAMMAEAEGRLDEAIEGFRGAVEAWRKLGEPYEHGMAALGLGRCLVASGNRTQAEEALAEAREIFQRLQAAPALAETDALLQQATALSS
jgi:class 3 adenylate cyclase/tetratricopeptide (TPR) repeat protein